LSNIFKRSISPPSTVVHIAASLWGSVWSISTAIINCTSFIPHNERISYNGT
jgi:hypothetical protein